MNPWYICGGLAIGCLIALGVAIYNNKGNPFDMEREVETDDAAKTPPRLG